MKHSYLPSWRLVVVNLGLCLWKPKAFDLLLSTRSALSSELHQENEQVFADLELSLLPCLVLKMRNDLEVVFTLARVRQKGLILRELQRNVLGT